MRLIRCSIAFGLSVLLLLNFPPFATACGPSSIQPIFVFTESPDLPFAEFTNGKIGIVKPTFGLKTLVIAYRYLNGGSFTTDEQKALVEALRGQPPETEDRQAIKAWIAARKEIAPEGERLPEIYVERQNEGYDFFPNCTKNAFEVATATLKERLASYGAEDRNVRAWLAAQDTVFKNCATGATIPEELGAENAEWLRKDRDYQIAAALFYSLKFDEARARFETIAADTASPWQELADYLVARTLVRQASLTENEIRKRALYENAEVHLQMLVRRSIKFHSASQKLLGLVKYRIHPEERVLELARVLAQQNGNENLRQDLIDYTWLLAKVEAQILKEEERRKGALVARDPDTLEQQQDSQYAAIRKMANERAEAIRKGEIISITIYPKSTTGQPDYSDQVGLEFKYDSSAAEILQGFESKLGRKLTAVEAKQMTEGHALALSYRQHLLSPNRKWDSQRWTQWEGCDYACDKLLLKSIPAALRSEDLSDWIFAFQTADPTAYVHALSRWRQTDSTAWLVVALAKAGKTSPAIGRLIRDAEKVDRELPGFATIAYHLVRLKIALGRTAEALKLLDDIIAWQPGVLPVSAQNQFVEERMQLANNLTEFLKFAQRKPITFYNEGRYGKLIDFLTASKGYWNPAFHRESKEDYEREIEESYKDLLPWDDRRVFDEATSEVFNWRFPLAALAEAARSPALPDYLRRRLVLVVWTRAVLLNKRDIAERIGSEVPRIAPEMTPTFMAYLNARTVREKENAALYVLLRSPTLSPFLDAGMSTSATLEDLDYHFETAWWCPPSDTDYNYEGKEVPKIVDRPRFLTPEQLETARRERGALVAVGDGKSYLGKRVIEWARISPEDPRIPEALFIAVKANESYKYGCSGWEFDRKTRREAERILRKSYPGSPWTAKLKISDN